MAQTSPPKKLNRKIGIAFVVIIVLVVVLVGALVINKPTNVANTSETSVTPTDTPYINSTPTNAPFDFNISILPMTSITVHTGVSLQGYTVQVEYVSGDPQTPVYLNFDSASSEHSQNGGILIGLDPPQGSFASTLQHGVVYQFIPVFDSTLIINVPNSIPTGNYPITVIATGGGVTHSATYTVSVLSTNVQVSGIINSTGTGVNPTKIKFTDLDSSNLPSYTAVVSGNSYSIAVPNDSHYEVAVGNSSGTFYSAGTIFVLAPIGSTSVTQNVSITSDF